LLPAILAVLAGPAVPSNGVASPEKKFINQDLPYPDLNPARPSGSGDVGTDRHGFGQN
jgi:hypothetical protein